jgi:hypothetical protein
MISSAGCKWCKNGIEYWTFVYFGLNIAYLGWVGHQVVKLDEQALLEIWLAP